MSDALADWLALREPADVAARSPALTASLVHALGPRESLHVLELGTGTGSNIRYLAPRLGGLQHWLALDRDENLLGLLPLRMRQWAAEHGHRVESAGDTLVIRAAGFECHLDTRPTDLDRLDPGFFHDRHLVTASALLDLVSERWLHHLAGHCRAAGAAALFALTYTGRAACLPAEPEDDWICDLLNRHQHRDKGLGGPAAGPAAADRALGAFRAERYHAEAARSPWTLDDSHRELQRQLVDGWAHAAREMAPGEADVIEPWRARRLAHLAAGLSRISVEHDDVAAWPRG